MEPRGSSTKCCGTAKVGEWAETGEQTPGPAQAAKHPKQSLICKVKTFTIYTVVPFTSREQNQSIYRWVRSILFKDRHEQNREKRQTKMWDIFFTKRNPKIAACKWTKGCRRNRAPQTAVLRTIALLSLPLSLQFHQRTECQMGLVQAVFVPGSHHCATYP